MKVRCRKFLCSKCYAQMMDSMAAFNFKKSAIPRQSKLDLHAYTRVSFGFKTEDLIQCQNDCVSTLMIGGHEWLPRQRLIALWSHCRQGKTTCQKTFPVSNRLLFHICPSSWASKIHWFLDCAPFAVLQLRLQYCSECYGISSNFGT